MVEVEVVEDVVEVEVVEVEVVEAGEPEVAEEDAADELPLEDPDADASADENTTSASVACRRVVFCDSSVATISAATCSSCSCSCPRWRSKRMNLAPSRPGTSRDGSVQGSRMVRSISQVTRRNDVRSSLRLLSRESKAQHRSQKRRSNSSKKVEPSRSPQAQLRALRASSGRPTLAAREAARIASGSMHEEVLLVHTHHPRPCAPREPPPGVPPPWSYSSKL